MNLYAPPGFWSMWYNIGVVQGPRTVRVSINPIGSTLVKGRIRYWGEENKQVEREFIGDIKFSIGNHIGPVELRLIGIPLGSAVIISRRGF